MAVVLALAASLLGLINSAPASAVPGTPPLITWNMAGGTSNGQSLWTIAIGRMVNGWTTPPIVALQEMGADLPAAAPGTATQYLSTANGGLTQIPAGAGVAGSLPPYSFQGGPQQVRHGQWASGGINHDVYFLQTDSNGDTWGGGRVNIGFVTERGADEAVIVPNPMGPATGYAARPALGLRFGGTWYFSVHALSGGGNDAPGLLNNISAFVTSRGLGEDWVALGDFNRSPTSLQTAGLPPLAGIFSSGQATQSSGGELDYAVYSNGNPGGVMVAPMTAYNAGYSDHTPVLVGQLQAAGSAPSMTVSGRAIESMTAGGVLDAYNRGTANFTPIDSYTRNNQSNQSWTLDYYNDGSVSFQGDGSGRCIDITHSDQNPGSGTPLSLYDCNNGSSQRWTQQYLGNDEYQFQSVLVPGMCMNISGGQANPNTSTDVVLYACANTPNERWVVTPGNPSSQVAANQPDFPGTVPGPVTLENANDGGVADADQGGTANGTQIVSWQRNGQSNQGWSVSWVDSATVVFRGVGSNRCLDIYQSDQNVTAGRRLTLWDCTGGQSQEWHAGQLVNGQVELTNVLYPSLCMDLNNAATDPNTSYMDVYTCNGQTNQQWILSPYDPSGTPTAPSDPESTESFVRVATPDPGVPSQRVGYYTSWSTYANAFYPKNLDTEGIAGKLTVLEYAFENIDPVNLTCMEANKPSSSDETDPNGNDGSSDAYADYQKEYTSDISVDGTADNWANPLRGNFNQLKELKAKYPNLKILVSIGGWTYSKFFSDVAATDASRKKFVASCIDMYIRGNLPQVGSDPAGGAGAAAGIFDGFDIDWEFPGSSNGHVGNHVSPQDGANYTALLNEFRTELNAVGGEQYTLTAALPAGPTEIANLDVPGVASALDFGDVMSYDMHGAFETNGPTNFQAPLFDTPASPAFGTGFTANNAITSYLNAGFPAGKLTLGVPFYGRGWTGVPDGGEHGRYQSVTGPTAAFTYSQEPGVVDWKELVAAGLTSTYYYDQATCSTWVYDGTNFWSIETPDSLADKRQYIKNMGLAGIMMYSLEADDSSTTLTNAATGMN